VQTVTITWAVHGLQPGGLYVTVNVARPCETPVAVAVPVVPETETMLTSLLFHANPPPTGLPVAVSVAVTAAPQMLTGFGVMVTEQDEHGWMGGGTAGVPPFPAAGGVVFLSSLTCAILARFLRRRAQAR
jgi:hypothetical protein